MHNVSPRIYTAYQNKCKQALSWGLCPNVAQSTSTATIRWFSEDELILACVNFSHEWRRSYRPGLWSVRYVHVPTNSIRNINARLRIILIHSNQFTMSYQYNYSNPMNRVCDYADALSSSEIALLSTDYPNLAAIKAKYDSTSKSTESVSVHANCQDSTWRISQWILWHSVCTQQQTQVDARRGDSLSVQCAHPLTPVLS